MSGNVDVSSKCCGASRPAEFVDACLTSFTSLSGEYHIDLAKMLPDVGIDGEVCIQRALKLVNVDLGC